MSWATLIHLSVYTNESSRAELNLFTKRVEMSRAEPSHKQLSLL